MNDKQMAPVHQGPRTKYYKATYQDGEGNLMDEVFISGDYDSAVDYAIRQTAQGRILKHVQEYDELIDSLL